MVWAMTGIQGTYVYTLGTEKQWPGDACIICMHNIMYINVYKWKATYLYMNNTVAQGISESMKPCKLYKMYNNTNMTVNTAMSPTAVM